MSTQQPEALRIAQELSDNADLDSAEGGHPDVCSLEWDAAAELRRQHARITELEAQLEAIGAGGVSPLIAGVGWEPATAAPPIAGESNG